MVTVWLSWLWANTYAVMAAVVEFDRLSHASGYLKLVQWYLSRLPID